MRVQVKWPASSRNGAVMWQGIVKRRRNGEFYVMYYDKTEETINLTMPSANRPLWQLVESLN